MWWSDNFPIWSQGGFFFPQEQMNNSKWCLERRTLEYWAATSTGGHLFTCIHLLPGRLEVRAAGVNTGQNGIPSMCPVFHRCHPNLKNQDEEGRSGWVGGWVGGRFPPACHISRRGPVFTQRFGGRVLVV